MQYFTRSIDSDLARWQTSAHRKPILLRGARQVGKTATVRELGKRFRNLVEINFLENQQIHEVFKQGGFDPSRIVDMLSAITSSTITDGDSLLFFDEVQACPQVIESLRFFYEKRPNLHVIAAGSLLEFALRKIPSFGVGRVDSLFMRPCTIHEFFIALGHHQLTEAIANASAKAPLPEPLHQMALNLLKTYAMIGGLPEVVGRYVETQNTSESLQVVRSIKTGYEDDFSKYSGAVPTNRLRDTLRAIAQQAGNKFVLSRAYVDAVSTQVHNALSLLELAGLANRVTHTSGNGIPLGAEQNSAKFKVIPHDIGLFQCLLGLTAQELVSEALSGFVHRGAVAEVIAGAELLGRFSSHERGELWYWHREAKSSSAEVDYLISKGSTVIPIEVKANRKGAMKSLQIFSKEKGSQLCIRISAENFGSFQNTLVVPLYAVGELDRIIAAHNS